MIRPSRRFRVMVWTIFHGGKTRGKIARMMDATHHGNVRENVSPTADANSGGLLSLPM